MNSLKTGLAAGVLLGVSLSASAVPMYYTANLTPLNNSGVSATARLAFDSTADTLNVRLHATGLEANEPHAMHIHGPLSGPQAESGSALPAVQPTLANDSNHDGFVELGEAASVYGEVLIPLTTPPGGGAFSGPFPTAPNGVINYNETFNLADPGIYNTSSTTGQPFDESQLFPLTDREVVIHGLTVPDGIQGNMTGGPAYEAKLPVATGLITAAATPVPEPGDLIMLMLGTGLIGGLAVARKRRPSAPSLA